MIVSMKERLCLVLILAGLFPLKSFAQYPSKKTPARFTIDERRGCAPLIFQVTNAFCDGGASCIARYDDGRPDEPFVDGDFIEYPEPGNFTFRIIAAVDANSDEIDIQVLPAPQPTFEVYSCETGGVQVVVTDTQFPEYIIDFNEGPEVFALAGPTPHNHTYSGPPFPTSVDVEVRGLYHDTPPPSVPTDNLASDNCPVTSHPVTIYPNALNPAPIEELRVLDDGTTIELDFPTADPSVQYRLMKAPDNTDTGFMPYKTIYNANTDVITSLLPESAFYCFRLDTFNPCGGNATSSNTICSINFDVTAQNNSNAFTIQTSAIGSPTTTLNRDGTAISTVSPDATVMCNTDYTYQARLDYPDLTRSISMNKTVTAFSVDTPPSIENISSAAGETSVYLEWQLPPGATATGYIISEVADGVNYALQTSPTPHHTDNSYKHPTDYGIIYTNNCGNRSLPGTIVSRPMLLTAVLQKDNTVVLNWSEHLGWKNGVDHYELYQDGVLINPSIPSTVFSLPVADDHTTQVHVYEIWAAPDPAAVPPISQSLSNEVTVIKSPNLHYPTAFTPNKDGLNDNFKVIGEYTAGLELKIFNRWGELMFITTDLNSPGWDGYYKGNLMPEGTYVFTAKIVDFAGRTFDRSGTVVLFNKE
jgi:gliding motility-associated-like protein